MSLHLRLFFLLKETSRSKAERNPCPWVYTQKVIWCHTISLLNSVRFPRALTSPQTCIFVVFGLFVFDSKSCYVGHLVLNSQRFSCVCLLVASLYLSLDMGFWLSLQSWIPTHGTVVYTCNSGVAMATADTSCLTACTIGFMVQIWVRLLLPSSQHPSQHLLAVWNLSSRKKTSAWV